VHNNKGVYMKIKMKVAKKSSWYTPVEKAPQEVDHSIIGSLQGHTYAAGPESDRGKYACFVFSRHNRRFFERV
jgi:hypothetical protein